MKLEKTLTFVLIATKTSWLFPQLKTDIKNLTNCLEQCNWILIYILLHFMVYPSFKEQNLLSPKQFWGQKSPLLPANSFFVPQLVRRTEESISGQYNHQVPSTVNGTPQLAAGQDKEKTQKRHRKDTEKTQKKDNQFFQRRSQVWDTIVTPTRGSSIFTGFRRHQQKSGRGLRRYLWCPVPRLEPSKISTFFSTKSLQKIDICPPKNLICHYNTSIQKPWLVSLFSKRIKAIFSFLKKNLQKKKQKNQRNVP